MEPHAIPAMRRALDESLADLSLQLRRLQNEGFIPQSWLGDETSVEVREYYNKQVMLATDGPYAALVTYETELMKVRETLNQMEQDYRVREGEIGELWGGRT